MASSDRSPKGYRAQGATAEIGVPSNRWTPTLGCGSAMVIVSVITQPDVIDAIRETLRDEPPIGAG